MDILGLHLSPRKGGNSEDALAEFIRGARQSGAEAETFSVADRRIEPCRACAACETTGVCVISGDDMGPLYPLLASVPLVVVSTSLFFYDVPAQGKALIDRTQALWSRRYALKQPGTLRPGGRGFLLALGATRGRDLFLPVNLCVKYFFDAIGLPKTFDSLFFRQLEAKGALKTRPDYLEQIYEAGLAFGRQRPQAGLAAQ
jgi:multimeric flavodoxin WrbA